MKHGFFDEDAYRDSAIHRLDARSKILAFFTGVLVCVSTPATAFYAFGLYAAALAVVIAIARLPLRSFFTRLAMVIPFTLMVAAFAPFLKSGQASGGYNLGLETVAATPSLVVWNVAAKSLISAGMVICLTSCTPFPSLLHGLRRLRVPGVIVMLLSFTYRYLFVMIDEFERMRRARDSRGYRGKWLWHASSMGHLIASMFIRTYERAEMVYAAMISRGFEGRFAHLPATRFRWGDGAFLAGFICIFLAGRTILA